MELCDFDENKLIERAIAADYQWCQRNGYIFQQPNSGSIRITSRDEIVLGNSRGDWARYKIVKRPHGYGVKRVGQ